MEVIRFIKVTKRVNCSLSVDSLADFDVEKGSLQYVQVKRHLKLLIEEIKAKCIESNRIQNANNTTN